MSGSTLGREEEGVEPPSLRRLRRLVTVLTAVLILGVITVVGLLVTRMPQALNGVPKLPEAIRMPEGAKAQAVDKAGLPAQPRLPRPAAAR